MGYVCPVCEDPQADGEHLANHLAFTAILGDDDHEAWLDEHVPDWGEADPAELAPKVTDRADETEFPQVFEDTTGEGGDHDHGRGERRGPGRSAAGGEDRRGRGDGDPLGGDLGDVAPGGVADVGDALDAEEGPDPEDAIAEARELMGQRRGDAADGDDGDETDTADGDEAGDGSETSEAGGSETSEADGSETNG